MQRVGVQLARLVLHQFQKPVDLAELVVHGPHHPAVGGENPHIHQGRNHLALGQQIALLPVVGGGGGLRRSRVGLTLEGGHPLFGDEHTPLCPLAPAVELAIGRRQLFQAGAESVGVQVFVEHLGIGVAGQLPAGFQPAHLHPPPLGRRPGLAEDQPVALGRQQGL